MPYRREKGREKFFRAGVRWWMGDCLAFMSGDGARRKQKDEANHEHEENPCYGSCADNRDVRFRAGTPLPPPPSQRAWPRGGHRGPDGGDGRSRTRHHRPRSRGGPPADGCGTCTYSRRPADGRGTCSYSRRAPTCRRCTPASGLSGSGRLSAPLPPSVSLSPLVMDLM